MFDEPEAEIDKFYNKDSNFSITWYSSLAQYYNIYLQDRLRIMNKLTNKGKKKDVEQEKKRQAREMMKNPCFLIAHELYDALPIHQFHYNERH